jgi:hypothetical protein
VSDHSEPVEASRPDLALALLDAVLVAGERGHGLSVLPFTKGARSGGFGSDETRGYDGWEVGSFDPNGGSELGAGRTLTEALGQAVEAMNG